MDSLCFLNTLKTGWIARPARGFLLLLLPRRQGEGWRAAILYNDGGAEVDWGDLWLGQMTKYWTVATKNYCDITYNLYVLPVLQ